MMFRLLLLLALLAISTFAGGASADPPSVAVQAQPAAAGLGSKFAHGLRHGSAGARRWHDTEFPAGRPCCRYCRNTGETVHAGERLLDFGASPAAIATYEQAVSALAAARQQRAHTAQLLSQQLATRDQLSQADKAAADAQATLDALRRKAQTMGRARLRRRSTASSRPFRLRRETVSSPAPRS